MSPQDLLDILLIALFCAATWGFVKLHDRLGGDR